MGETSPLVGVDAKVSLREVTAQTVREICELSIAPGQERFVAPTPSPLLRPTSARRLGSGPSTRTRRRWASSCSTTTHKNRVPPLALHDSRQPPRQRVCPTRDGTPHHDHAATAVPDEHDRLGLRVQHLRDPVRIALQRDFRDQGPVLAMPGKVRASTWWPAPSSRGTTFSQHQPPTNPQCTNTNLLSTRLLYFWASCSPNSDVYLWSR
jgi:hypothetical protein